ncbi:hypothetical protein [Acidimangrovimonas pyrenivorans]|uniref:Uncharacterized protein n=1 Tax=Acidimangrovimonas pyrenivorans TaxID=2030798 RepID=A0ABV7AJC1_9RHOB
MVERFVMRHARGAFAAFVAIGLIASGLSWTGRPAGAAGSQAGERFDVSKLPVGTVIRWQAENGNTTEHFLGRDGDKGYKISFRRDGSRGHPLAMTWWVTRDGQLTRAEGAGISDRYLPNDCSLTLGRCKFIVIHEDGRRDSMISIASRKGDRWSYQLFRNRVSEATRTEYGTFTVDRYGFVIDHDYVLVGGHRGWIRRLERKSP